MRVFSFLAFCLVIFLSGCRGHQERFERFRTQFPGQVRLLLTPFSHEPSVLVDDAKNFSMFFEAQLAELPMVNLNTSAEAVESFKNIKDFKNTTFLRRLADHHLVEGILSGRVHRYYYKISRKSFTIEMDITVTATNTYTGQVFFETRRALHREYRLRRSSTQDYSQYNLRALTDWSDLVLNELITEINRLAELQKDSHGGKIPTRLIHATDSGPQTEDNLMHIYLWPVDQMGRKQILSAPVDLKSEDKSEEKPLLEPSIPAKKTEAIIEQSAKEALSLQKEATYTKTSLIETKKQEESSNPSSPLNLDIPGFELVYPKQWDGKKKYQKFYYLIQNSEGKKVDANEAPGEETMVFEIFSTTDEGAVNRFIQDYFQGETPSPRGQIPEVYERNYLGKYQAGFIVKNMAAIATISRDHHDSVLSGLSRFYTQNGGISVSNIVDTSIKSRFQLADVIFEESKTPKPLEKQVQDHKKRKAQAQKPKEETPKQEKDIQLPAHQIVKKEIPPQSELPVKKSEPQSFVQKDQTRSVYDLRPQQETFIAEKQPSNTKETRESKSTVIPANAVFCFDMGKRYYLSGDFDSAKRYFLLAKDKGYLSEEIKKYLEEIEVKIPKEDQTLATPEKQRNFLTLEYESFDSSAKKPAPEPANTPIFTPPSKSTTKESAIIQSISEEVSNLKPVPRKEEKPKAAKLSPGLQKVFDELELIEKELEQIKSSKKPTLSLVGSLPSPLDLASFLMQMIFLIALTVGIFAFLSTKNIKN